jgi:hypothetical protein
MRRPKNFEIRNVMTRCKDPRKTSTECLEMGPNPSKDRAMYALAGTCKINCCYKPPVQSIAFNAPSMVASHNDRVKYFQQDAKQMD